MFLVTGGWKRFCLDERVLRGTGRGRRKRPPPSCHATPAPTGAKTRCVRSYGCEDGGDAAGESGVLFALHGNYDRIGGRVMVGILYGSWFVGPGASCCMSFKLSQKQPADSDTLSTSSVGRGGLSFWLLRLGSLAADSWEAYLILLVAAFLRFYQINTTEFDDDQAKIYRMAYDAVHRGLLPTTSDVASIGIAHPPGLIYLFMPIAALSANPLGGAVLTAFFTSVAALLTYFFTRRYYGRFAAIAAALLYATAARPLNYARFIWQPNLMPPFVVLFIFALYWGVVERRKGWLFPALFLLGVLYQMHPTTLLLAIPLFVAVVLAPGTVRWRDLAFAVVSLLIIFLPYLLWEAFTHFADVRTVFSLAKQQAHTDSQALGYYRLFLIPYDRPPTNTATAVGVLAPILSWLIVAVPVLTLGGFLTAGIVLLRSEWHGVRRWWMDLRANPSRCGLLVLLSWQIVPLLILRVTRLICTRSTFLCSCPDHLSS